MEVQRAFRTLFNQLPDFVAMPGACFEKREDQQLGAAFFPFAVGAIGFHICNSNICERAAVVNRSMSAKPFAGITLNRWLRSRLPHLPESWSEMSARR